MSLAEQTALAHAYQCAKAALEAAEALLPLLPDTLRSPARKPLYDYVAGLRDAERAAWNTYLSACRQDVAEFQADYEGQQRCIAHLMAA